VNLTDDQRLRQRLHADLGALEISPPPVLRVTGRGQGIRLRRRVLTAGTAIAAALAVAAAAHFTRPAPPASVTLSQPNPAAPGGVFASGTFAGKRWKLAVRNIAAAPGIRSCLPAVMFNGQYGDVLFKLTRSTPSFGNPALLAQIPGMPGISAMFTQVADGDSRLVGTYADGRSVTARAVRVRACGTSFNLAGFAFASRTAPAMIATYNSFGLDQSLVLSGSGGAGPFPRTSPGIWSNLDKSQAHIAASKAQHPIGTGTVRGQIWHMRASLGLFGQCYTGTLRILGYGRGQGSECVPVAVPPRTFAVTPVPVPDAQDQLPGYAVLVNPRTAYALASITDGATVRVVPAHLGGRAYLAVVAPAGCELSWLKLVDSAGHVFAQGPVYGAT